MKLKLIVLPVGLAVLAILVVWLLSAQGGGAVPSTPFIALSGVPGPEIPNKAAELVHTASAVDHAQAAQDVLRVVPLIAASPGVLPFVVSAICRGDPETAGTVVARAIQLQPEDDLIFTKAALCAAPGQVEQVVASACKAAPGSYAQVALVASRQLPGAYDLILAGVLSGLPALKPDLEEAEIEVGTKNIEAVINRTVQLSTDNNKTPAK